MNKNDVPVIVYPQKTKFPKEKLYELYIKQKMSINQIRKKYGGTHQGIKNELIRQGISPRTKSEAQLTLQGKTLNSLLENYNWLYENYILKRRTLNEIAEEVEHSARLVKKQLKKYNFSIRGDFEAKIGVFAKEKHPNWKGGITPLSTLVRRHFTEELSPKIRERDNYTCQMCGKVGGTLHVHHIISLQSIISRVLSENPFLTPSSDKYKLFDLIISDKIYLDYKNLITYCKDCHYYKVHKYQKTKDNKQPS